jgi:predicted transcriptional regulator
MKKYEKTIDRKALSTKSISLIYAKVYPKKKIADFISASGVPINSYYKAMEGKEIKAEYIHKILNQLKKYA